MHDFPRKTSTRYELCAFREAHSVEDLNKLADEWNYIYNYVKPHQSLGYLTPMEFFSQRSKRKRGQGVCVYDVVSQRINYTRPGTLINLV